MHLGFGRSANEEVVQNLLAKFAIMFAGPQSVVLSQFTRLEVLYSQQSHATDITIIANLPHFTGNAWFFEVPLCSKLISEPNTEVFF